VAGALWFHQLARLRREVSFNIQTTSPRLSPAA
jgi:hypothetical protein